MFSQGCFLQCNMNKKQETIEIFNNVDRNMGPVPGKDMHTSNPTPPHPLHGNGPIFMKDAQSAETNEKSVF